MKFTVKPLYSGHHLDLEKVGAIERCALHRGLSKLAYFTSKTVVRVSGYSEVKLQLCQDDIWVKEYKDNIYIKYFIFRHLRLKRNLLILLCFKADNFIFWTLCFTSAISPVSVALFSIMEKWSKSSRYWSTPDVVRCREVFSSWSSSSSSETTFTAWLALEESGTTSLIASLSSLFSPVYQVGIYLRSRCCQIIIKGNKIFNSDFVVLGKLSEKTLKFFIYFIVTENAVDWFLSKPTFLEAVNFCLCRYISLINLYPMNCFSNVDILYYFWGVLAFVNFRDQIFQWPSGKLRSCSCN